jgi:hypothetical protein
MNKLADIHAFYEATRFLIPLENTANSLEMGEQKRKFMDMYNYCKEQIVSISESLDDDLFFFFNEDGVLEKRKRATVTV